MQSVDYFLGTQRMATPTYFWHFLDIIRSKIGQPLLEGLALAPDKFVTLLTAEPDPSPKVQAVYDLLALTRRVLISRNPFRGRTLAMALGST